MRTIANPSSNQSRARASAWAGFWLACLAALFACTAGISPALTRRLPILGLPLHMLARFVACLIVLRAIVRLPDSPAPIHNHRRRARPAGEMRALLRAALHQRFTDERGYNLAKIVHIIRNPEIAITLVLRIYRRGLTRRRPVALHPNVAACILIVRAPQSARASADTS